MRIVTQIRLLSIGLMLVTALAIGITAYWGHRTMIKWQQDDALKQHVMAKADRFEYVLSQIGKDASALSRLPATPRLAAGAPIGGIHDASSDSVSITDVFVETLRANDAYDQIRLISARGGGREIIRVERGGDGVRIVPAPKLQRKGHRQYFRGAMALGANDVYVSDITLNREHDAIEVPHHPMLRVASPIYDSSGAIGIIVINVDYNAFARLICPAKENRYSYYMADDRGQFTLHPDPAHTFAFELGGRYDLFKAFPSLPPLLSTKATTSTARIGTVDAPTDMLVHFRKLPIFPQDPGRFVVLGAAATYDVLGSQSNALNSLVLAMMALLFCVAVVAAYFAGALLTRPLESISQAADRVSRGNSAEGLPLQRRDEIGVLSRSFERMIESLRQRELRLASANERMGRVNRDLDHFVHFASHDLAEPTRRVAALADIALHREGHALSAATRELLETAQSEARTLMEQVSAFRTLATLEEGPLERCATPMAELLESVLVEFSASLKARRVTVRSDVTCLLNVYPGLVTWLYRNLIDNALTHVSADGFELSLTCEMDEERCVLGVRNTCSSIEVNEHVDLFRPFSMKEGTVGGSGMGLSVCKRIVERHAGTIWLVSGGDYVHFKFDLGKDSVCLQSSA